MYICICLYIYIYTYIHTYSPRGACDNSGLEAISRGERPFIDILQDRRYWVIHIITIPSLFLAGGARSSSRSRPSRRPSGIGRRRCLRRAHGRAYDDRA